MNDYIFSQNEENSELKRLKLLEWALDDHSISILNSCGISRGMKCLEIGAGAGSILKWMGQKVGMNGIATGCDQNVAYLNALNDLPYEIIKGNFHDCMFSHKYDLIHLRYVLIHNREKIRILEKIHSLLKKGGELVVEEPDFSSAKDISGSGITSHENVNKAMNTMFRNMDLFPDYGLRLPGDLVRTGFSIKNIESVIHLSNGKSKIAVMMAESAKALKEKYTSTGIASENDINNYIINSYNDKYWSVYYSTISIVAVK